MDEDKDLIKLTDYLRGLVVECNDGQSDLQGIDTAEIESAICIIHNSINYLDQMRQARRQFNKEESKNIKLQKEIDDLKAKIQENEIRESTHAGMCSAFQSALFAVGRGFADGSRK